MTRIFFRKINSAAYYIRQYQLKVFQQIIDALFQLSVYLRHKYYSRNYPVLIGTVFYNKGGVFNHICSLHHYLKTENIILPPTGFRKKVMNSDHQKLYFQLFEKFQLDKHPIVHSHADTWFINRCYHLHQNGSKWVHTYHSFFFEEAYYPFEEWMKEMNETLIHVASEADVKIVVSKWFQNYLKENFDLDSIYIPNCADLEKCEKADRNRFIEKYQIKDFVLFASSLLYVKNPLEFIQLAENVPQLQFVMLGTDINQTNLSVLYKKVLPPNLIVLENSFNQQEVLDAIDACKVFVLTSRLESLPTALLEAMALEKPVVAPNRFGCLEIIENEEFGYLYSLGNMDELKQKTLLAFNNPSIGKKARQKVYDHYNWKVVAPQIDKIYQDLIAN